MQVVADMKSRLILCVDQAAGKVHDFQIYKDSIGSGVGSEVTIKTDSGYQGIADCHANNEVPFKKSKNRPLSKEERLFNRRLSVERVMIEHINREIKIFKIMSYPYRNRRRRHHLRISLLCDVRKYDSFTERFSNWYSIPNKKRE
jgi:hypothetical protein